MREKIVFQPAKISNISFPPDLKNLFHSIEKSTHRNVRSPHQRQFTGRRDDDLTSLFQKGVDYYLKGRFPEALDVFGSIYIAGKDGKFTQTLSYLSYVYLIIILRWIVRVTKDPSSIQQGIRLIEEGLKDLEETERTAWRAPLLLEKALYLDLTGNTTLSLDLTEESYQVAKSNKGPSWPLGYHGVMVSRFSRRFNDPDRSLKILDEVSSQFSSTYTQVQVLTERLRILQVMRERLSEAIDLSRILENYVQRIIGPRTILEAHVEMMITYFSANAHERCLLHLDAAKRITLSRAEFHHPCLIQEMDDCLRRMRSLAIHEESVLGSRIMELTMKIEQEKRLIHDFW